MNGFWGADTEALRTMGAVCSRRADVLDELEGRLSATLDSVEWTGEDAERFRADWAGIVRPGLQDRGVELRQQARRLAQHAEEQEAVSSPDSIGGPWSSPGEFLADMARAAEGVLRDLLAGGAGAADGAAGRMAELLREALSTPEGRAAFLGALLGSLLGGLLADLLQRGLALGMLLEELLAGLGAGGGAGAGIGNVIGEDGRLGGTDAHDGGGAEGGSGAAEASGTEVSGTGGAAGSGADGGAGSGGGGGGSSSGGGTGSGGSGGDAAEAGSEGGGEDTATAPGRSNGLQGAVDGPTQAPGSQSSGRLDLGGEEEPGTLFERLIAMIGEMLGGAPVGDGAASSRGTAAVGEGIGWG